MQTLCRESEAGQGRGAGLWAGVGEPCVEEEEPRVEEGEPRERQGERQAPKASGARLTHQSRREVAWERSAFMKEAAVAQQEPYEIMLGEIQQNLPLLSRVTRPPL